MAAWRGAAAQLRRGDVAYACLRGEATLTLDGGAARGSRVAGIGARGVRGALTAGLVLLAVLAGCSKKIGNSCKYSTDCSAVGDRLCDPTQTDGYCTIPNCEPDGCPSGESVCVAFTEPSCPNLPTSIRFARNFCMATCSDDGDCRDGYTCVDKGSNVVDTNPDSRKVCLARSSTLTRPSSANPSAAVCQPASFAIETEPPEAGQSSNAIDASVDASADAADGASTEQAADSEAGNVADSAAGDVTSDTGTADAVTGTAVDGASLDGG